MENTASREALLNSQCREIGMSLKKMYRLSYRPYRVVEPISDFAVSDHDYPNGMTLEEAEKFVAIDCGPPLLDEYIWGDKLTRPKELSLHKLIEFGVFKVLSDYEMHGCVRGMTVAVSDDGQLKIIDWQISRSLGDWGIIPGKLASAIEGVGTESGVSIAYVPNQGNELIFVAAVKGSDRGLCVLALRRKTGDTYDDIALITQMGGLSLFPFSDDWGGPTCAIEYKFKYRQPTPSRVS